MPTVVVNGFRATPFTTDSTDIPVILVHVIPIEAHVSKLLRATEELFPNGRVRGSSSLHGSVATLGIHRGYVGILFNEVVEDPHVVGLGTPFQLRLA